MTPDSANEDAIRATGLSHRVLLAPDPEAPLVFLVHGRAGNSKVMWAFRRAFPEHCSFIAPQAPFAEPFPIGATPDESFSWWDVRVTTREAITSACNTLESFMRASLDFYSCRPRVQLAAGFSQGAGLLSSLIQRESRFIGVALLAGFVLKEPPPYPASKPSVFMAHGLHDEIVPLPKAEEGAEHLRNSGYHVEFHTDPVGHKVGTEGGRALKAWASGMLPI